MRDGLDGWKSVLDERGADRRGRQSDDWRTGGVWGILKIPIPNIGVGKYRSWGSGCDAR